MSRPLVLGGVIASVLLIGLFSMVIGFLVLATSLLRTSANAARVA